MNALTKEWNNEQIRKWNDNIWMKERMKKEHEKKGIKQ